jgi:16S rRNA (adenine1518-N6/adenine1519-N6)-dimethyltransferase
VLVLSDPSTLRRVLAAHGLSAKKGLGQHFLCSASVVDKIVARVESFSGVLEIGPGPGVLTGPLSQQVGQVTALELDERMAAVLAETAPQARVVLGNALHEDLLSLLQTLPEPRAVVSNLPYYITGPLVTRIAEARAAFAKAVLMMQKEVGVRVLAPTGSSDRGSLTVFLQSLFEIEKVTDAPPGAFLPPPKVSSLVLELRPKPPELEPEEEAGYFGLVRGAFRQPRKTLANNLARLGWERE